MTTVAARKTTTTATIKTIMAKKDDDDKKDDYKKDDYKKDNDYGKMKEYGNKKKDYGKKMDYGKKDDDKKDKSKKYVYVTEKKCSKYTYKCTVEPDFDPKVTVSGAPSQVTCTLPEGKNFGKDFIATNSPGAPANPGRKKRSTKTRPQTHNSLTQSRNVRGDGGDGLLELIQYLGAIFSASQDNLRWTMCGDCCKAWMISRGKDPEEVAPIVRKHGHSFFLSENDNEQKFKCMCCERKCKSDKDKSKKSKSKSKSKSKKSSSSSSEEDGY